MKSSVKSCFSMIYVNAFREALQYTVCSILLALSTPVSALLIEGCINAVADGTKSMFYMDFLTLAIVLIASVWTSHVKRVAGVMLNERLNKNCTPQIVDKLNCMQYFYFDDASAADTLERISRNPTDALAQLYKVLITCVALAIRIFGVVFLYCKLSVAFGLTLAMLMVIEIVIGIKSNKEFGRLLNAELPKERKLSYIGNLLCQKESVFDFKINQSIGYAKCIQKKLADSLVKERIAINLKAERYYLINVLLMLVWTAGLLAALINGRVTGTIELGVFCTLIGSYPLLTQYQSEMSYYLSAIGKDWIIIQALQDFFAFDEVDDSEEITDAIPEIKFSDVCFKYPGTDKYVLRNINFTLSPGQTIALVGENGSGKSTIIKLLCGLYTPTEGTVTVNGIPICKLSQTSRNRLFSSVFQDFQTYSISVAENIGLGSAQGSNDEQKIDRAMKKARIDAYVKSLPNGADTHLDHLDENGVNLSGGQRQRLVIARAYMSNAHYFLLDEPTAAMDPVAESQLYQSFAEIAQGKGAVLVSHRLASSVIADRILVLCDGAIVQSGTHSDLMSVKGIYKEMFNKQSSWYTEMGADQ